jgi:hypothetical protein
MHGRAKRIRIVLSGNQRFGQPRLTILKTPTSR